MALSKSLLILCSVTLLIQVISSQYIGGPFGPGPFGPGSLGPYNSGYYGPNRYDAPYAPCNGVASTGGSFPVRSVSPIAPTGLTVVSENVIEGQIGAGGQLPFLGTVALEGAFPTAGVGAISYACGNGAVGITSEGPIATGILNQGSYGPISPLGPLPGQLGPLGYGSLGCSGI